MTLVVGTHVQEALAAHRPVLALESTIITHGLPRPRNVEVALESEDQLRAAGVTPATIGVLAGRCVVGLSADELRRLADDDQVQKASTRDLPWCVAKGLSAGTTVAATAHLAHAAGIRVFSTGGLGGVHRGASETFDESADIPALAALPIVLVSAGVKAILDIPATLERMETLNIPVVGYRTLQYPGFYVADSGHRLLQQVDSPEEVAAMVAARDALGLPQAICVANPVPESEQLDPELMRTTIEASLAAAQARGVHGHDITPFLLEDIRRATGGASLETNLAVYRGNVALGAEIAKALAAR